MRFEKGNNYGKGRPKGTKNLLPEVRQRVLQALQKRISADKALTDVSTEVLIRFLASIAPKEIGVSVTPQITYISNTPRPYSLPGSEEPKQLEDRQTDEGQDSKTN